MAAYRCRVTPEECPVEEEPGYCRYHSFEELVLETVRPAVRQWSLHIPALGHTVPIPEEGLEVGRDASAFTHVSGMGELDQISRSHARLEWRGGTLLLIDRGSTNGTYVDGAPLPRDHPVEVGPHHTITFAHDVSARIVDDDDL